MICITVYSFDEILAWYLQDPTSFQFKTATVEATWETDPKKQKELFDKVKQEIILPHVEKVEQHFIKNGNGHLVGQGVSLIYFLVVTFVI